ncbi:MAG: AMP-binding protein, partial [bacterium]|nr:AMP-binding protein [bacterium]
ARVGYMFLMPAFRRSHYVDMVRRLCREVERQQPGELMLARLPELRRLVVFDPDSVAAERPAPGFTTWEEVLEAGSAIPDEALDEREATLDADDPINIQFTSGTTGFPKPVVLTHHNILNNGFFIGEALGLTPEDRVCVPVPFYHCFGMVISNLGNLSHGATTVIPAPHFNAGATLAAVDHERCTVLHGVPTMFVAEFERPDFADFDLSRLRTGVMAGAPCPPDLLNQVIDRMGCYEVRIAYGQTEASPVTHITRRDDSFDNRTRTVGRNMPHSEVKVIDPATGAVVPMGEPGEICFRGYHVMRGY